MPSYARRHQLSGSLVYHIYNRGNFRLAIFNREDDYRHFINLLKNYKKEFNYKIYHWVIMPNHYHLVLEIEQPENISRLMAGLARAYTHYYHREYLTAGFLWQGRFKLQPVQKEKYLIACGRYIERNPIKANIAVNAADYPYGSAAFYCKAKDDGVTTTSPEYFRFGQNSLQRQVAYAEFLKSFDSEEESSFERLENPIGNSEFVRRLIRANGRYIPRRKGRLTRIFVA